MKKKDYRQEIHALFEEVRSKIKVKEKLDVLKLHMLDKREGWLLEENSRQALDKALELSGKKEEVYVLPHAGKKFVIFPSGKIKMEVLP